MTFPWFEGLKLILFGGFNHFNQIFTLSNNDTLLSNLLLETTTMEWAYAKFIPDGNAHGCYVLLQGVITTKISVHLDK